ncbi:ATP-grasp domain-containing protein [Methanoregula sp.]|uniref:ATP-grasp domain-containing protein n=1 Tax=Methanoregula sp. TaxID=2052170 RepID=UPI00356AE1E0
MNKPGAVVIVDGFTVTGRLLTSRFRAQGISCIGVLSTKELQTEDLQRHSGNAGLQEALFEKTIVFTGDPGAVLRELDDYAVIGIIPGSGTGLLLADTLSERMNLCTNGTRRSAARFNKFQMQQTLIDAGVPTKEFILASDEIDLLAWYRSRRFGEIVIKPANCASGMEILYCTSEQEVLQAFRKLLTTMHENGEKNAAVLVEECLVGTEYCVDTVSRDGKHRLAGIRTCRNDVPASHTGDRAREQDTPDEEQTEVIRYTVSALEALRIRYGAASTRIMMTGKGPLLLNTMAWMHGGTPPCPVAGDATHRKADLVVEAYCDPEGFKRSSVLPAPGSGSVNKPLE